MSAPLTPSLDAAGHALGQALNNAVDAILAAASQGLPLPTPMDRANLLILLLHETLFQALADAESELGAHSDGCACDWCNDPNCKDWLSDYTGQMYTLDSYIAVFRSLCGYTKIPWDLGLLVAGKLPEPEPETAVAEAKLPRGGWF